MLIPNPILFGPTPAGGAVLPVTADRGGLAGYVLLGQLGPPATVEVSAGGGWTPLTYPHTLTASEQLRLTRTDLSSLMTTLLMLAPVDDGPLPSVPPPAPAPFSVQADPDGYQLITNAEVTTDPEGYQTIQSAVAAADAAGYQTVERSTT